MNNEKSITPNAPADFTPTLGKYNDLQPFRYWCHKVLPLVYDDSLSYYELLCKVVAYLNETMEDVETLRGDITKLHSAYAELQSYVNNYFSSLDVQEEINNKLDNMVSSGELYEIIRNYTDPIINEQNDKIKVLETRMNTFASLPNGSTSGDAELIDIRIGYDGAVYNSAGNSVRGQANKILSVINNVKNDLYENIEVGYVDYKSNGISSDGYVNYAGTLISSTSWRNYSFNVVKGELFKISTYYVPVALAVLLLDSNNNVVKSYPEDVNPNGGIANLDITMPTNVVKMIVNCSVDFTATIQKMTYTQILKHNSSNILHNKSFVALGDSITYGAGLTDTSKVWGNLIAQRNNMNFTNAGVSGSTMGEPVDSTQNTNPCWKNERYKVIEGKDYAIIWFGWNDYNFCSLGTYDGTDTTKTLVAYRKTLEYVIEHYVTTKVGVIIPYIWDYNDEPQDHTIMEMLNGIKDVCDLCGVPYLDLPKYNFLPCWGSDYPNNDQYYIKWNARQEVFTTDSLHPNEKGNEYLSTIIESFLRTL